MSEPAKSERQWRVIQRNARYSDAPYPVDMANEAEARGREEYLRRVAPDAEVIAIESRKVGSWVKMP